MLADLPISITDTFQIGYVVALGFRKSCDNIVRLPVMLVVDKREEPLIGMKTRLSGRRPKSGAHWDTVPWFQTLILLMEGHF